MVRGMLHTATYGTHAKQAPGHSQIKERSLFMAHWPMATGQSWFALRAKRQTFGACLMSCAVALCPFLPLTEALLVASYPLARAPQLDAQQPIPHQILECVCCVN